MDVWRHGNETDLEGELGRAHDLHDVECSPGYVVAQHLQLERMIRCGVCVVCVCVVCVCDNSLVCGSE